MVSTRCGAYLSNGLKLRSPVFSSIYITVGSFLYWMSLAPVRGSRYGGGGLCGLISSSGSLSVWLPSSCLFSSAISFAWALALQLKEARAVVTLFLPENTWQRVVSASYDIHTFYQLNFNLKERSHRNTVKFVVGGTKNCVRYSAYA